MTEQDWLTLNDPGRFWQFLYSSGSPRKVRLYACGCARRVWSMLKDIRSRHAIEASERYADRSVKSNRLHRARRNAEQVRSLVHPGYFGSRRNPDSALLAAPISSACKDVSSLLRVTNDVREAMAAGGDAERLSAEGGIHVAILRDVYGNPFRPVALDPTWLTPAVTALARQMYDARDFGAMPILADALQDAGCGSAGILEHCRGPGPHIRGCWVVDFVLGKK